MLNNKKRIKEEKECAEMLGMTVDEYRYELKNVKIPKREKTGNYTFDNTILKKIGLNEEALKKNKYCCD